MQSKNNKENTRKSAPSIDVEVVCDLLVITGQPVSEKIVRSILGGSPRNICQQLAAWREKHPGIGCSKRGRRRISPELLRDFNKISLMRRAVEVIVDLEAGNAQLRKTVLTLANLFARHRITDYLPIVIGSDRNKSKTHFTDGDADVLSEAQINLRARVGPSAIPCV